MVGLNVDPSRSNNGVTASSSARISAALDAGETDKPTSLLYRMWAQFGDLSLPEQNRGAPEMKQPSQPHPRKSKD